jgi:hypothetical protein
MTTQEPVIVRMRHIREARMCSSGARAFFERHGLDWGQFLKQGIEADKLSSTGDAMALAVVEVAKNGR